MWLVFSHWSSSVSDHNKILSIWGDWQTMRAASACSWLFAYVEYSLRKGPSNRKASPMFFVERCLASSRLMPMISRTLPNMAATDWHGSNPEALSGSSKFCHTSSWGVMIVEVTNNLHQQRQQQITTNKNFNLQCYVNCWVNVYSIYCSISHYIVYSIY